MNLRYGLSALVLSTTLLTSCEDPAAPEGPQPANLFVVTGDNQVGSHNAELPDTILILATDSQGLARAAWTLGAAGEQTLTARAGSVLVTLTAEALPWTRVAVPGGPYGLTVGANGVVYATRLYGSALAVSSVATKKLAASIAVGDLPTGVTFNPAGTEAYVTNQGSGNVSVVSAATNSVVAVIDVGYNPFVVAFSSNGASAYVAVNAGWVYKVNTATRAVVDSVFTADGSNGLALSPDGSKLYVSTSFSGTVCEVTLATMTVARTFTTGGRPQGLAVSPDGGELYVANEEEGRLEFWNLATGTRTTSVTVSPGAFGLAMTPNAARLYVAVNGGVVGIDRVTRGIVENFATGGDPRRLAFSTDGQTLVVANLYGWIDFIP